MDVENDLNFKRAMIMMPRIETPFDLIIHWRTVGPMPLQEGPEIEYVEPWYSGIEDEVMNL